MSKHDQLIERLETVMLIPAYYQDEIDIVKEAAEAIRELTLLQSGAKIISDEWENRAVERQATIEELQTQVAELQDFAIWMTGCGYDFCQHDYFCEQRDKLLKGDSAEIAAMREKVEEE